MTRLSANSRIISLFSIIAISAGPLIMMTAYLRFYRQPPFLAGLALGLACLASGLCGLWYCLRHSRYDGLISAALKLGFTLTEPGWNSPDGKYDVKGTVKGVEILMSGRDLSSKRKCACARLEVVCRTANKMHARLAAYPSVLNRPLLVPLPPKVGYVPSWDWYTVHSEPADAAARLLSGARRDGAVTIFQDEYGFEYLELKDDRLRCVFRHELNVEYLGKITGQLAELAASL